MSGVWNISHRFDPAARELADRHYNRRKVGSPQFAPPGRCLVLVIPETAFWITSWPFAEYVRHAWAGAWVCSAFRNEDPLKHLSSDLVREAVAATRWRWPDVPSLGMITFVNEDKTRRKRDPGRCFRRAGFVPASPPRTRKEGLIALQLHPQDMPDAKPPLGVTLNIGDAA